MDEVVRIEVLMATCDRPQVVDTLASLARQVLPEAVRLSVLVVDNDDNPSAEGAVRQAAARLGLALRYRHAPGRNISIARNAALASSEAVWVAFIDDDEVAEPGWIAALWAVAEASGADAVFGPVEAVYPETAQDWVRRLDLHSNRPVVRAGRVETGHTCNALLRWQGTAWEDLRFEEALGRTGGEDTAFFRAAGRRGMVMEVAQDAVVREAVPAERLRFGWLARRRLRMGQSHARGALPGAARVALLGSAAAKAGYCGLRALVGLPWVEARAFWTLRGLLHVGVVAGLLGVPMATLYGHVRRDG